MPAASARIPQQLRGRRRRPPYCCRAAKGGLLICGRVCGGQRTAAPAKYAHKINAYGMNRYSLSDDDINNTKKLYTKINTEDIILGKAIISYLRIFYKDSRNSQILISEEINNNLLNTFSK